MFSKSIQTYHVEQVSLTTNQLPPMMICLALGISTNLFQYVNILFFTVIGMYVSYMSPIVHNLKYRFNT